MTAIDPALRRYYRAVCGWLPGSRKLKKQVIAQLRVSVTSYLEQEPDASFDMLRERFGEPQAIAAAYVDNTDTAELLRALRVRRRVVTTVTAAAVIALILWAGVVTWAAVILNNNLHGGILVTHSFNDSETYIPNIEGDPAPPTFTIP